MRSVFMGTPEFAVPSLEALIKISNVVAVFTQPDKRSGRKMTMSCPPVKEAALKHNIDVFQPSTLKDEKVVANIKELKPDIIVVAAYGKILPEEILNLPKYGCINIHASILPKYRGASPIQYAILNGDKESGVTVMQMDAGLDTGDILDIEKVEIGKDETMPQLSKRLSILGAEALLKKINMFCFCNFSIQPQWVFVLQLRFFFYKVDYKFVFSKSAVDIYNKIRALNPWPGCRTSINGKQIKIISAKLNEVIGDTPGMVINNKKNITICCGDLHCIDVTEVQPEGKKQMSAEAYLAGNKINIGTIITKD